MRPINAHVFRTTVKHPVSPILSVDFPITGVVIVPNTEIDLSSYISRRTRTIAPANLAILATKIPGRVAKTVELLLTAQAVRQAMGLDAHIHPSEHDLEHSSTATNCMACETAALRIMDKKSWRELRAEIEEMCDNVMSCPDDFPASLESHLNLLISQR